MRDAGESLSSNNRTKQFVKSLQELDSVFAFLDGCLEDIGIGADQAFTARLAVEEIFANMVKHNDAGANTITMSFNHDRGALELELIDHGVAPFEIPEMNSNDIDESAKHGKTGGRGIFLIRQMVDKLEYEHRDGNSVVRLSINLRSSHA